MTSTSERVRLAVRHHPLAFVALVGFFVALSNVAWFSANRPPGTLNTDEAGYIAFAMRIERSPYDGSMTNDSRRAVVLNPVMEIRSTISGPLAPTLSAPFIAVGGRTTGWAQAVQPFIHVLAAVGVAGIALRLGSAWRSVVAGLVVLGLPVVILSSRAYQLAGTAAACLALAVWALLASERGRRLWPMLAFGACVGLLLLSRTMAVVFLPGLVVAALIEIEWNRRTAATTAAAVATGVAIAAPWWLFAWNGITDYLVRYGYGDFASAYGSGGIWGRIDERISAALVDVRLMLLLLAAVVVYTAAFRAIGVVRRGRFRGALARHRPLVVVVIVIVSGYSMLLTSDNAGIWFELPLELLAVAAVVSLSVVLPVNVRVAVGALAVAVSLVNVVAVGRVADVRTPLGSMRSEAWFGDMYEIPGYLESSDPSMFATAAQRRATGDAWWSAHEDVADAIDRLRPNDEAVHLTITGSNSVMSYNTLLLAQEVHLGSSPGGDVPDSTAGDLSASVDPWQGDSARVIVVIRSTVAMPFPADAEADRILDLALAQGWEDTAHVDLPDGGEVVVLAFPESIAQAQPR